MAIKNVAAQTFHGHGGGGGIGGGHGGHIGGGGGIGGHHHPHGGYPGGAAYPGGGGYGGFGNYGGGCGGCCPFGGLWSNVKGRLFNKKLGAPIPAAPRQPKPVIKRS